eukprot:189106-Amphidinium_carterae.1
MDSVQNPKLPECKVWFWPFINPKATWCPICQLAKAPPFEHSWLRIAFVCLTHACINPELVLGAGSSKDCYLVVWSSARRPGFNIQNGPPCAHIPSSSGQLIQTIIAT